MGELIGLVIRVALMWLQNRFDPEMIKFREIKRIRNANEAEKKRIDWALRHGDTVALSAVWRELQARDCADGERAALPGP